MINAINLFFSFLLPIIVPLMLGGIGLALDKFNFGDMFLSDHKARTKAIGIAVNRLVFGLFSFDLWVIISFAENTQVSFTTPASSFSDKYAVAIFTLLLHLFAYIYSYAHEFVEEDGRQLEADSLLGKKISRLIGREMRYIFLFLLSFALCVFIRL